MQPFQGSLLEPLWTYLKRNRVSLFKLLVPAMTICRRFLTFIGKKAIFLTNLSMISWMSCANDCRLIGLDATCNSVKPWFPRILTNDYLRWIMTNEPINRTIICKLCHVQILSQLDMITYQTPQKIAWTPINHLSLTVSLWMIYRRKFESHIQHFPQCLPNITHELDNTIRNNGLRKTM